ncbi:MAG: CopG family transcriptional regulator [Coleofasciculaceae cyanobacterium SM2_1_6]|nr:CopG family transcriptional regulator [Coleofasciculaceae cyanobacterium SM2_1_6]
MSQSQGKQRVTVTIDAKLLKAVDQLSANRSAAIEEALHLWHRQRIEAQLQRFYANREALNPQEEEQWAQLTQDMAITSWEHQGS